MMGTRRSASARRMRRAKRRDLGVAVLLDHVDPLVPFDESDHLIGNRQGANPAVLGGDPFVLEHVAGLGHGGVRAAIGDQADAGRRGLPR